jgi:hypothetical protein
MDRPPLEVADLVRAAGDAFIERNRHWLHWKHIKVLLAIRRCRTASAVISMSAPAADIVPPSRITAAAIAIGRSVRPLLGSAGLLHVDENFSRPTMRTWFSHCLIGWLRAGATEQKGPLRSPVPHQCGNRRAVLGSRTTQQSTSTVACNRSEEKKDLPTKRNPDHRAQRCISQGQSFGAVAETPALPDRGALQIWV